MRNRYGLSLLAMACLGVGNGLAGSPPDPEVGKFKVTCRRSDDSVQIKSTAERVTFSIRSPFGISHAVIERAGEWPKEVVLRLHLKGLENFQASNGKVTLQGAVGIRDGKPQVRLWKDDREREDLSRKDLSRKDPLWTEVRIVGADGKPATRLPLDGGHFELTLPRAFFEGNPRSVKVSWIDFYRE